MTYEEEVSASDRVHRELIFGEEHVLMFPDGYDALTPELHRVMKRT